MSKKIFVVAGEASGDVLGGALMRALKEQYGHEGVEFAGIGGKFMQEAGLESLIPMKELCVMGITEVLEHLPRLLKLIRWVADRIEDFDPDAVVFVDLPDFNFRVAKLIKKRGGYRAKLIHYVAPTVWAWREGRAKHIAQFLDGLMCLFPFEPEYFTKHGLKTSFVGHPLVERHWIGEAERSDVMKRFKEKREVPDNANLMGVMFGSRVSEFEMHAPIFAEALSIMREQDPNLQLVVPTLPHLQFEVMSLLGQLKIPAYIVIDENEKWEALACVDVAMAVSGTVALELAYADIPHVVAYKTSRFNWLVIKMLVKTKFAHLANIILQKPVVPEHLQDDCTPEKLAAGVTRLRQVPQLVAQQKKAFAALRKKLGGSDSRPGKRAAEFVAAMLEGPNK